MLGSEPFGLGRACGRGHKAPELSQHFRMTRCPAPCTRPLRYMLHKYAICAARRLFAANARRRDAQQKRKGPDQEPFQLRRWIALTLIVPVSDTMPMAVSAMPASTTDHDARAAVIIIVGAVTVVVPITAARSGAVIG